VVPLWTRILVVLWGCAEAIHWVPPLDRDQGVEIDIPLGILSMILVNLGGLSRRLPFKDGGKDMTRVITHDWWRVIRW